MSGISSWERSRGKNVKSLQEVNDLLLSKMDFYGKLWEILS